ncbi:catechol 2,3-dioxygenase [Azorhizobium sp. AG788]|uniref:VOC family protein n=1 Tax=Azorhizobium sp. AG788 TaxID=2183897 RepID=UPI0010D12586|nr:VOC family protein [Azorhizobium sp. AG788]TDT99256.1 catechol 2,3-dioxygenase [Azorhizobium sp. AG788]
MTATLAPSAHAPASGLSLAMGRVVLTVHDLAGVAAFYERAVGLHRLRGDGEHVELGVRGTVLLELRRDAAARRSTAREAGLFHTAFLLPSRVDLARWTHHAMADRVPVVGASDHAVSEAIYLTDPEGNGVEIYADRPASAWRWDNGSIHMVTEALRFDTLMAEPGADTPWQGFPEGAVVGHVHLQVGAVPTAEAFYAGVLGFDITTHYPGAAFYAANGYHHHLATNIWNSRGAAVRTYPSTGLSEFALVAGPDRMEGIRARTGETGPAFTVTDPWGTVVRMIEDGGAH